MQALIPRVAVTTMIVGIAFLVGADAAGAKILPVDTVEVVTTQPTAGHPIAVVVRFGENFDLGDFAWENSEVGVLPADRTDADGWPLDQNDRGVAVPLRRISKGVYRGTFVVNQPGDYVVIDWSSVYAHDARAHGDLVTRTYAAPIRVRIGAAAPATARSVASSGAHRVPTLDLAAWVASCAVLIGIVTATAIRRRTRPSRTAAAVSPKNDERTPVASGHLRG
jgi:hypothetical protein